jgi:endo-1,4-beta-xylanase
VPAVKSLMTFGLSDRYTWLQEDFPREDGAPRRPLPYDRRLQRKPAYRALRRSLDQARRRKRLWRLTR